jgi:NADH-quinone oxidoreductase subunit J
VFSQADFLAVTQIKVYVGGVLVLMIFGIMLSKRLNETKAVLTPMKNIGIGVLVALGSSLGIYYMIAQDTYIAQLGAPEKVGNTITMIGENLILYYLIPFELAALLLLLALVGAAYISGESTEK